MELVFPSSMVTFTVNDNTSSGNYKNGIYVGGTKKDTGDSGWYKFAVGEVKNNTISNNTANNASQGGIHLKKYIRDSEISNNTVTGQHLQDEAFGIMLEGHSTHNNLISNNTVTDNVRGILFFGGGGIEGGVMHLKADATAIVLKQIR
jgi:parallel beta-helix repeat protein